MAIKVAVHRVCDRCQSPFDATSLKYGEELPRFEPKSIAACVHEGPKGGGTDIVLFCYDDLCPDCDRVVDGYIRRIRMEEADEVKPKKSKKSEKTPDTTATGESEKPSAKEARFEPAESHVAPSAPDVKSLPSADSTPALQAVAVSPHPF